MAVTFRASSSASKAAASGASSIVVNKPTGVQTGDIMVAHVAMLGTGNVTFPAGWTLIGAASGQSAAYRVVPAGEGASYTVTLAADENAYAMIASYSGVHGTAPVDTTAVQTGGAGVATPIDAPAATASVVNCLAVRAYACRNTSQTAALTTPAGHTSRATVSGGAAGTLRGAMSDVFQGAATAVAVASSAATGTAVLVNKGFTVVLRPSVTPPNAPTALSPSGNVAIDRSLVQRFSWLFSDPDAGDTQSKFDLQYRLVGGTYTTITTITANSFHDFAANALAAGDYEWSVRVYDALGGVGSYSASSFFTAANTPAAPTITQPVNNATIGTDPFVVQWSYPTQTQYQVRRVADLAGVADPSVIYFDSGIVENTTTRSLSVAFPVNRVEHVQVRIRDALLSPYASAKLTINTVPPAVPTLVVTPNSAPAFITVAITNPAPTGSQPAVASHDVWRREGGVGAGVRIATLLAPGATFTDRTPASGVDYSYQVVAVSATTTRASSVWVG